VTVRVLASFKGHLARLEEADRQAVTDALNQLFEFIDRGKRPMGLGFRKLRDRTWEIRAGLKLRVLMELDGHILTLILVGSHDDIQRALRRR